MGSFASETMTEFIEELSDAGLKCACGGISTHFDNLGTDDMGEVMLLPNGHVHRAAASDNRIQNTPGSAAPVQQIVMRPLAMESSLLTA